MADNISVTACISGSAIKRQIDQVLDWASIEILPMGFIFELDLFPGRVRRKVNAKQVQARECAAQGLGDFPTSRYGAAL